jgi:type IV pilus assembly protein PilP
MKDPRQFFPSLPLAGLLLLSLSGCSRHDDLASLHAFVDQAPTLHPKIQPLPAIPHYSASPYDNPSQRDPFASFSQIALWQQAANASHDPLPVTKGPLQPLQKYALGSITLSGIMQADGRYWGVFLTPEGKVYRAGVGDPIGDKSGKIIAIDAEKHSVTVMQYVPNAFGGYVKQNTTMQFHTNDQN